MSNMVKTTIVLPEEVLQQLKIKAIQEKTTVSRLLLESVHKKTVIVPKREVKKTTKEGLLKWAGAFKVKNPIPADKIRDYIDYSEA